MEDKLNISVMYSGINPRWKAECKQRKRLKSGRIRDSNICNWKWKEKKGRHDIDCEGS